MVKYLRYLLYDVEMAIQQAPPAPNYVLFPDFDEEEEKGFDNSKPMKVDEILGIPVAAFPPHNLLTDDQVTLLLEYLQRLWKSYQLESYLPDKLSERQRYNAMLHAMRHEEVNWNYQSGGTVKICRYDDGSFCPFGGNGGYCHCKELDDSVKHDLAIWEEHVRSQGIDPYRELTKEEEEIFERETRVRNHRKQRSEDKEFQNEFDFFSDFGPDSDDDTTPVNDLENENEFWLTDFLFEEIENVNSDNTNLGPNYSSGLDADQPSDEWEDDFDTIF